MSQLIESIRIANGEPKNLDAHQERVNVSYQELYEKNCPFLLKEEIHPPPSDEIYKCRILYDKEIQEITIARYTPVFPKKIKAVHDNEIDYHLKFADRSGIDKMMEARGDCDEILIIQKGLITDASKYNVLLFNGGTWITPKNPLLKGVLRNVLLQKNIITAEDIPYRNINDYSHILLINALNPFNPSNAIPVNCIY